jgi:GntR family transcriptional regulator
MLCASGKLQPSERLPSVRELARELAVNQNTILRVYERLVSDGLLEMRHGQGTFVAQNAKSSSCTVHRERLIEELRQLARQSLSLGLTTEQIHELLTQALGHFPTAHNDVRQVEPCSAIDNNGRCDPSTTVCCGKSGTSISGN